MTKITSIQLDTEQQWTNVVFYEHADKYWQIKWWKQSWAIK